ncbi:MAG: hypothetical protein ACI4RG_05115 [Huintestinicola sp.]
MKYEVTFSCGHTETVELFGKNEERERKIKWYQESSICNSCYKERKKKYYEDVLAALEDEAMRKSWPEIKGYSSFDAKKRRSEYMQAAEKLLEDPNLQKSENTAKLLSLAIDLAIKHTDAEYWVNFLSVDHFFKSIREEALASLLPKSNDASDNAGSEKSEDKRQESTLITVSGKTLGGVVELCFDNNTIYAYYEKNDTFMSVVKSLDYKWSPSHRAWYFKITERTGTAESRIAELANILLSKGFSVIVPKFAEEAALSGEYEPRCTKWIDVQDGKFRASWSRNDPSADTIYKRARSLPRAKWQDGGIIIPITSYAEVKDFADTYGFNFSCEAQELYNEQIDKLMIVTPVIVENTQSSSDPLDDKLCSSASEDIPEDLIDD